MTCRQVGIDNGSTLPRNPRIPVFSKWGRKWFFANYSQTTTTDKHSLVHKNDYIAYKFLAKFAFQGCLLRWIVEGKGNYTTIYHNINLFNIFKWCYFRQKFPQNKIIFPPKTETIVSLRYMLSVLHLLLFPLNVFKMLVQLHPSLYRFFLNIRQPLVNFP